MSENDTGYVVTLEVGAYNAADAKEAIEVVEAAITADEDADIDWPTFEQVEPYE